MKHDLAMISFRLEKNLIDELDAIAERLAEENFGRPNRTAVLRYLISLDRQRNKSEKNTKKSQNNA